MRTLAPPKLTYSPLAWLKLQCLCQAGATEVGGFGLSAPGRPLYVEDVLLVKQTASAATVSFHDSAVADLFDRQADAGVPPSRFARIWIHTHPGSSPLPSGVDERTFARVFGPCDWAVMAILSRTGRTYARLAFGGGAVEIPVEVDWAAWPAASTAGLDAKLASWRREHAELVQPFAERFEVFDAVGPVRPDPLFGEGIEPFDLREERDGRVFAGAA